MLTSDRLDEPGALGLDSSRDGMGGESEDTDTDTDLQAGDLAGCGGDWRDRGLGLFDGTTGLDMKLIELDGLGQLNESGVGAVKLIELDEPDEECACVASLGVRRRRGETREGICSAGLAAPLASKCAVSVSL